MRTAAVAIAFALLAAPASARLATEELRGHGAVANVDAGVLAAWPSDLSLQLEDLEGEVLVVDDYLDEPLASTDLPTIVVNDRRTTSHPLANASVVFHPAGAADRVLIAQLLHANATVSTEDDWTARTEARRTLERTHVYPAMPEHSFYYDYQVADSVNWTSSAGSVRAEGAVRLYAWGANFTIVGAGYRTDVATGTYSDYAGNPFVVRHHAVHAIFTFKGRINGTIEGTTSAFAPSMTVDSDLVELDGRGDFRTDHGTSHAAGPIQVQDGAHEVHVAPDGLAVDTTARAATGAVFLQSDPATPTQILRDASLALALAVLALLAAVRLGLLGRAAAWEDRAHRLQLAGHDRWAAMAARVALRFAPTSSGAILILAARAAARGRHERALGLYGAAFKAQDGPGRGLAAYEAARAAARARLAGQAAHWLGLALEARPSLLGQARREPDFARIVHEPAFANSLRVDNSPM